MALIKSNWSHAILDEKKIFIKNNPRKDSTNILTKSILDSMEGMPVEEQISWQGFFFQHLQDENVYWFYRIRLAQSLLGKIKYMGAERQRQIKKIALAFVNDSSLQMEDRISLALKLILEVKAEVVIELGAKVLAWNLFRVSWNIKPLPQISINKSFHTQASPLLTFFFSPRPTLCCYHPYSRQDFLKDL